MRAHIYAIMLLLALALSLTTGCGSTRRDAPTDATNHATTPNPRDPAEPTGSTPPMPVFTPVERIDRVTLASGLVIEEMRRGTGELCIPDSVVRVRYSCRVLNGTEFDSSGGDVLRFDLRKMIKGWQEGLPGMLVGGVRRLTVPPELGYGARELKDADGSVLAPANSVLVYEVELVGVE